MSHTPPLTPELEALVHEIARDPRSCLLRVDRPIAPHRLVADPEPISIRQAGLTAAEREILGVHRAELASLLTKTWLEEIERHPPQAHFIARGRGPTGAVVANHDEEPDHAVLESHSRALDIELPSFLSAPPARTMKAEELSHLVTLAARLQPSTFNRIYVGLDLTLSGQPRTSAQLFRKLLQVEPQGKLRSFCWAGLASAMGNDWNPADLVEWNRRAFDEDYPRIDPLGSWLLLATQLGDVVSALQASERLEDLFTPEHPAVALHCENQARTRRSGQWSPRRAALIVLPDLYEAMGPTTRRILDVMR